MAEEMEDELQRLLDTELEAEALVREAELKRERMIRQALEDARTAEQQFEARVPELRASFMEKAEERAVQAVAELARRYEERCAQLRTLAQEREQEAIQAALTLLLDPKRG
jgi:V/A-type H+-transporting ATPase subunit G/H